MATLRFVLVGSGAVRVNPARGGPCQLVKVAGRPLLFDCGRLALHQLEGVGYPVETVQDIFLTHLHFDHICELPHLALLSWNNGRVEPLRVWGPPGTRDFLEFGVRRAYAPDIQSRLAHGKDPQPLDWRVQELEHAGTVLDETDFRVEAQPSLHAGLTNLNYRVDVGPKRIVITSDTQPDDALVDFCRNADLLVCECSGTAEFLRAKPWGTWHMNPETVADLARRAAAKRVVLKHLVIENWTDDPEVAENMAATARTVSGRDVRVGFDGMKVTL